MNRISQCCTFMISKLINYPSLGYENTNSLDMLVSFLLAISPLLQHYRGIAVNAGIFVLIVCLPYVCLKLLFKLRTLKLKNILFALPLVIFQVFRVVVHGTTFMEFAHGAVLCGYFIAVSLGGINLRYVARSAYLVAMAASVAIIIQSVSYYLFDFHLQLVATDLLLEESNAWIKLAETGIIGVNGAVSAFYRPSAFFLEPSHMFLYFIPNLFLLLLTPGMNWVKRVSAVILSIGLILSTSGMGIVLVVGVWLLQLGFGNGKDNVLRFKHLFCKQNILRCIAFVLIFVVIAFCLPSLRYSILRIFIGNNEVNAMFAGEEMQFTEGSEGSTAISGRTKRAISLIRNGMTGSQYLLGVSDSVDNIDFNLPGFFATMYKYGIIGTVISYIFYLSCAMKGSYRWMAIIILGASLFSAHTHGTFYMLFYVLILMDGMVPKGLVGNRDLKSEL